MPLSSLTHYQALQRRVRAFQQRFGWAGRRWWVIILGLLLIPVGANYLWDLANTRTFEKVEILNPNQNSNNFVMSLKLAEKDDRGLNRVLDVRNVSQWSDLHFFPGVLQDQAAAIFNYNQEVKAGREAGPIQRVTVRVSGWGFGNANRSANITQIDPGLPTWSYNFIGAFLVWAFWASLLVGLPKLGYLALTRRGKVRAFSAVGMGLILTVAFIEWFIL